MFLYLIGPVIRLATSLNKLDKPNTLSLSHHISKSFKPHLQIFSENQQYQAKSLLESFRVTNHIVEFGKKVADAVTLLSELPVRISDLFG